jgi:outer membrane protein assembly factor BamB
VSKLTQSRPGLAAVAAGAALAGALGLADPASAAAVPPPHLPLQLHLHQGHGPTHPPAHRALPSVYSDWPMFRDNPTHTGVSPETAISTTTAASLVQTWTAKLGSTSDTSPAVVTNTTLGKALVYAGANNHFYAYPAGGGAAVWTYTLPAGVVETSPAVFRGVVYIGSTAGTLFALNATTGALMCSYKAGGPILASPVAVEAPNGSGPVVYDGTIPGNGAAGAEFAMNGPGNTAGNCTQAWKFTSFAVSPGGSWSSPAFATSARGVPLVVFGSKDTDDAVYALNARTGTLVWRYRTSSASLADVGASPVISQPGQNGFAGGVVYAVGKDKSVYAINLTTGALIWKFALQGGGNPTGSSGDVGGAALLGSRLYVPSDKGMYALNAITGTLVWHVLTTSTFYASPAVTGPAGRMVLADADNEGRVWVLNLATGATLWEQKPTWAFWVSPTVSHGAIYVAGLDGVLRRFAPSI